MSPTGKPTTEDIDLFRRSIGPIRRLRSDKVHSAGKRPSPRPRAVAADARSAGWTDPAHDFHDSGIAAGEALYYARPGLQQRLLQRLRRGRLPCEAELDLHGMTIVQAQSEVARLLGYCAERGIRSVRIIHGKGHGSREQAPVLKNRLNQWLRERPEVLAFSSSRPNQGGTGAVDVLLRSRK